ncbi:expressed protein [Echinococcus multilocularis]|uniref:Expressed protein n=1 Tax=Echinococcus multilocularis TaxID=6211 RepID=A0A068Y3H5_ECHMU|nr:expressed protein [Echinococcus multilocularis]
MMVIFFNVSLHLPPPLLLACAHKTATSFSPFLGVACQDVFPSIPSHSSLSSLRSSSSFLEDEGKVSRKQSSNRSHCTPLL